ncbi:uncharacterized protein PAC_06498 [Phialocephala subalpina]|uniref:Helicase C-terminal domain-containing protein n=1 Tax=Phialocephala subalpina TaxID=576137 RepID=A0A1L7WV30_9HELO|nr:uncharacterized protein PAC_06498 [Phialocephala subalpina]
MRNDKGVLYTIIDGNTSLSKRNEALRSFQRDNSARVILVSITCGGAGLDLTAGAYLLEPHWSPMIEEQAPVEFTELARSVASLLSEAEEDVGATGFRARLFVRGWHWPKNIAGSGRGVEEHSFSQPRSGAFHRNNKDRSIMYDGMINAFNKAINHLGKE